MNENILKSLLQESVEREWSKYENAPEHKFSLKHRLAMKKIFKLFSQNTRKTASNTPQKWHKPHSIRKRLMIAAIIIICLVLMTGFALLFISKGFVGNIYHDNTHLYAVDVSDCPSTIEKVYTLSVVPEGYELYLSENNGIQVYNLYKNASGLDLIFEQSVKSEYDSHINTEGYALQGTDVNGCNAVYIEYDIAGISSIVIWDNGDYILELSSEFNKEDMRNLAESAKVLEN